MNQVCIVGASGKLGKYMVQHTLGIGLQERRTQPSPSLKPSGHEPSRDNAVLEEM